MVTAFRRLRIVFGSFVIAALIPWAILYSSFYKEYSFEVPVDNLLLYVAPFLAISLANIERLIIQVFLKEAKESNSISRSWYFYQLSLGISWLSIELSVLFCLVAAYLAKRAIFLAMAAVIMFRFLHRYPKAEKFILDFDLKASELEAFFKNIKNQV
jgi:hypothetical protein